ATAGAGFLLPSSIASAQRASSSAALLDEMAWRLLATDPEQATALGVDRDDHGWLRARLKDRSRAGMEKVAALLRDDLALAGKIAAVASDASNRTSLAVIRRAYRLA